MSPRAKIYIITSGFFVCWAAAIIVHRMLLVHTPTATLHAIRPYLIVPYVFLYPAGFALTWFVEQSMKVHFKHRVLVWIPMACAGGLYLSLAIMFFIHSTII
jgi:hypothetical protein